MQSVFSLLAPSRVPTALEQEAIAEVIDLAREYWTTKERGLLTEILRLTTPRQRNLAIRFTQPGTQDFAFLMALLDDIIRFDPRSTVIVTVKGEQFEREVIEDYMGKVIELEDGGKDVLWPIQYPWKIKPDANGFGGVRDEPVYPVPVDRYAFRKRKPLEITPAPKARQMEWWEAEDGNAA